MGKKTELLQLPTRMLAVELGSQKRWRRVVLFGGIGAVVVAGLVYAVVRAADKQSAARLEDAWAGLGGCLLGTPLAENESAGARVSAVQLSVVGMSKDKRGKPGEAPWPTSCAPAAFTVAENAGSAENGEALQAAANALAKALKEDVDATADLAPLVDKLWASAKKSGLKPELAMQGITAPSAASVVFARDRWSAIPRFLSGNFVLADVHEQASSAPPRVRFVIDSKDAAAGPALCTAAPTDATIRCVKVPAEAAKMSPGLSLAGTTEDRAQPFYFAGDRGQMGIFPPNGDKIVAAAVSPGSVSRADGAFLALARSDKGRDVQLVVAPPSGAPSTRPLLSGSDLDPSGQAGLFWDWLVYKGPARSGPSKLLGRRVGKEGAEPAAAIEIGTVEEPSPTSDKEAFTTGCRSDDGLAVRVAGATTDVVALFAGGRWSAPVKTGTRGGALTCRGVEAVTTQVTHAVDQNKNFPTVRQARCAASGCTTTVVQARELLGAVSEIAPADASAFAAADVNGKLLLVWNAGAAGGLRMRLAPAERIKDAADVVITDGRGEGGAKTSTLTEVRVISGSTYALVFVGTTTGVRVLFVDGVGRVVAAQSSL